LYIRKLKDLSDINENVRFWPKYKITLIALDFQMDV
jgi:hypothetical protein